MAAMLILLLTFSISSSLAEDSRADYTGWKVLDVLLDGDDFDNPILSKLNDMENPGYLEILRTNRNKGVAEVAVSPEALEELREQQQDNEIFFSTVIHDLSKKLDTDIPSTRAVTLPRGAATYDRFMNVDEIMSHLEELPRQYPNKVSLKTVGYSVENRSIYLVSVTTNIKRNVEKPIIFVDGGIHAREWISPAAALSLIGHLVESPALTRHIEFQIIPLVNPDGYAYSWKKDRLWRKNRGKTLYGCSGTDLNRNFGYHWGESGSSGYACSGIYKGKTAFSEPESRALRDAMLPIKDRIEAYITMHSYGQYFLHPWGYTSDRTRYNDDQLLSVGNSMAKAIKKIDGTAYTVGSGAKVLYPAAGASDDWAAGELKIPLVYTLELRDDGAAGFVLPNHLIIPAVNDAWVAIKVLSKYVINKEGLKLVEDASVAQAEHRTREPAEPEVRTAAIQERTVQEPPVYREPVYIQPVYREPVYRRPVFTRPIYRRPTNRGRYDDSSEESSSSSEESSEEDSDEDRK